MSSFTDVYQMLGCTKIKRNNLNLPSSFRWVVCAPSGGKKTQFVLNVLDELESDFDHILFVVKTPDEPLYQELRNYLNNPDFLRFSQTTPDLETIPPRTCIVLDDQINESKSSRVQSNYENNMKLFVYGRKLHMDKQNPIGTSIFYLTQSYGDVPMLIRKNANIVSFRNPQASDLKILKGDLELGDSATRIFEMSKRESCFVTVDRDQPVGSKERMFVLT